MANDRDRDQRKRSDQGSSARDEGDQKSAPPHAEGQRGEKAHARLQQQLHEGRTGTRGDEARAHEDRESARDGERRLVEDRQQHDEAEKNSEQTRVKIEAQREHLDGPSDNRVTSRGRHDVREHRADYKNRDSDGFVEK